MLAYRTPRLPRKYRQVLGLDLNCSKSCRPWRSFDGSKEGWRGGDGRRLSCSIAPFFKATRDENQICRQPSHTEFQPAMLRLCEFGEDWLAYNIGLKAKKGATGDAAIVLEIALFNRSPHPNRPLPIRLKKLLRGAPREVLHAWHRGSPSWAAQHAQSCPGTFRAPRFGQSGKQLFVLSLCGFGSEAADSKPAARKVCAMLVPGRLSVGGRTQGSSIKSASRNLRRRTHLLSAPAMTTN
jgi:hypothetical protein